MSQVRTAIHNHHAELLDTLTKYGEQLSSRPASFDSAQVINFLKNDLLSHASGEEEYLYPAVENLIKAHGQATATMQVDHQFIKDYVHRIEVAAAALTHADSESQEASKKQLERLILDLEAIFKLHLEKEEQVYLPLFEKYLPIEEQQRILDGMHENIEEDIIKTIIDVRQILPPQRHPLIFQTFENLQVGEVFQLVNDHNPKPLFYQFQAERKDQFKWEYVEEGPKVWRVNIGRVK